MSDRDFPFDPDLDLRLERVVDLPPAALWAAWTQPELLPPWFCPQPWTTIACTIDLRPGGLFSTVMRSPAGQDFPNSGSYLLIEPERRLIWTNVLQPGFRPSTPAAGGLGEDGFFAFTAELAFLPEGSGTRYVATVRHGQPADRQRHEEMGFQEGWGIALDQLVAFMKTR